MDIVLVNDDFEVSEIITSGTDYEWIEADLKGYVDGRQGGCVRQNRSQQ